MSHQISGLNNLPLNNPMLNSILQKIESSELNSILFCDCNNHISDEYLIIKISDYIKPKPSFSELYDYAESISKFILKIYPYKKFNIELFNFKKHNNFSIEFIEKV